MLLSLRFLQLCLLLRLLRADSISPVPEFLDADPEGYSGGPLFEDDDDLEEDEAYLTPQITGGIMEGLQVGRIVHFVTMDGEHLAGIISHIWNAQTGMVNLHVFHPLREKTQFFSSVGYSAEAFAYTWHYPERV